MVKKSLQSFYNSGEINFEQKETLKKFGINDNYPERERRDFMKLWYWDEILRRNRREIDIEGQIEKMIFFSSIWNNNLLIIINSANEVNFIVYEMPMKSSGDPAGGWLKKFLIGNYSSNYIALNEVRELESKLKYNDNPILLLVKNHFSSADLRSTGIEVTLYFANVRYEKNYDSIYYPMMFPFGIRHELPFYDAKINPDQYIKPLDIVLITKREQEMVHACIYLGDKKVCHVLGEYGGTVKIDDWDNFLEVIKTHDKIIRYHPTIPFKRPEIIIRHIAKSLEGRSNYFNPGLKSGSFRVWRNISGNSNNCENFTNACVLGLNFSELDDRSNQEEEIMIGVEGSLQETTQKLDNLLTYYPSSRISEIEGYINRGNQNRISSYVDREGIQMNERIETQPNSDYRLNDISMSFVVSSLLRLFL